MQIPRIYTPQALTPSGVLQLEKQASKHLTAVLRLTDNAQIIVFDGTGNFCAATIANTNKSRITVQLSELIQQQPATALHIHLGLVMSKGDRMDYAIQKSVEAGVTEITPLTSSRCVVHLDEKRQQKKLSHWSGIINSACEQSGRFALPTINPVTDIGSWLAQTQESLKLVFDGHQGQSINSIEFTGKHVAILIGPEGGLTENEVNQANSLGFKSIRLGLFTLRTETAAVASIVALQTRWGDY